MGVRNLCLDAGHHTALEDSPEPLGAPARAPLQELGSTGDWAARRPHVRPGGLAFQYASASTPPPDCGRYGVVVAAMHRATLRAIRTMPNASPYQPSRHEWIFGAAKPQRRLGRRSTPNNDRHYLDRIPFADHGALLDPPTVDVSARCVRISAGFFICDIMRNFSRSGRWRATAISAAPSRRERPQWVRPAPSRVATGSGRPSTPMTCP